MPAPPTRLSASRWATLFLMALTAGPAGCAYFAKQPDTPARRVTFRDLNDPPPPQGERYYVFVFGAQTTPKLPRFTHTWVTFVRAAPAAPGCPPAVEHHSISWMPATLFIRTYWPCVEPGVNLTLYQSIEMALGYNERVSLWGPYEIPPGVYRKLMIQKAFVESGAIGYQCIDTYGEAGAKGNGSDCIHAISDVDPLFGRQAYPLTYYGDAASLYILRRAVIRGAVPDIETTHDWLIPALGLDRYPIVRREYTAPLFPNLPRFGGSYAPPSVALTPATTDGWTATTSARARGD
jgi:hypothetical protein